MTDDYKIGEVLGSGAYGEVRICQHRKTNITRAVKIIIKEAYVNSQNDKGSSI
jgi:serine/threonine protein kinase